MHGETVKKKWKIILCEIKHYEKLNIFPVCNLMCQK
jgi:hypothetical protein